MIDQKFWLILPYSAVEHFPYLRISPMGVVPQKDRRPRTIVDYSYSGVNQATLSIAPNESMQFGRALERIIQRVHYANRRFGPVFMIKVDIADGFYRLKLSPSSVPSLGVVFPTALGEDPLVAFPLVLPMGWVSSLPFFCALAESVADVANSQLQTKSLLPAGPSTQRHRRLPERLNTRLSASASTSSRCTLDSVGRATLCVWAMAV
jgi:hypothetical protein